MNAQVKKAEAKQELEVELSKSPERKASAHGTPMHANSGKFLSTIDLLRQQKEMRKRMR